MKKEAPEIFVGIDIAHDDTDSIFKLAEEVEGYVNLIVIGSINVTFNVPKLTIARVAVPKFVTKVAGAAILASQTYLDHILNRGGRLCAHK